MKKKEEKKPFDPPTTYAVIHRTPPKYPFMPSYAFYVSSAKRKYPEMGVTYIIQ